MNTYQRSDTRQLIEPSVLDAPLAGRNLPGQTLRELIADEPTLLVFLRHFG